MEAALREYQVAIMSGDLPPVQHAMLPVINLPLEAGQVNAQQQQQQQQAAPPPAAPSPLGPASPNAPAGKGVAGWGAAAAAPPAAAGAVGVTPRKPPGLPAPSGRPPGYEGTPGGGGGGGVLGASALTQSFDKNRSVEGRDIETELESQLLGAPAAQQQGGQQGARGMGVTNVNSVSLENASEKHDAPGEQVRAGRFCAPWGQRGAQASLSQDASLLCVVTRRQGGGRGGCTSCGACRGVPSCAQVQDNIHFMVNNLSSDNVDQRANDIKVKVSRAP